MNNKLSICIPVYNGFNFLKKNLEIYSSNISDDIEIIICDDGSNLDNKNALTNYLKIKNIKNLHYFYFPVNRGMDVNFNSCVEKSSGDYLWFLGQDDFTDLDSIKYILNLINLNFDIYFLNYKINQTWRKRKEFIFFTNLNNANGFSLENFLKASKYELPSFLPSLVIKKLNWKTNITDYYDTGFIQLGMALNALKNNCTWHIDNRICSYGVIPDYGWQSNPYKRVYYFSGYLSILNIVLNESKYRKHLLILELKQIIQYIFLLKDHEENKFINFAFPPKKLNLIFKFIYFFRYFFIKIVIYYYKIECKIK